MKVLDGYEERESAHEKNRYVNQRRRLPELKCDDARRGKIECAIMIKAALADGSDE